MVAPSRRAAAAPAPVRTAAFSEEAEVCLSDLPAGWRAVLSALDLPAEEGAILAAMGLELGCELSVQRHGEPCIVCVCDARLGLSRDVACRLRVRPRAGSGAGR